MLTGGVAGLIRHMLTKLEAELVASNHAVVARCQAVLHEAELKLFIAQSPRRRAHAPACSSGNGMLCYLLNLMAASL